jgi:anti-sigma factor RsiW
MISEETLWEFIDETLNAEQREAIARAIETDSQIAAQYNNVLALHRQLQMQVAASPGNVFTQKVMDAVYAVPARIRTPKISLAPVIIFTAGLLLILAAACFILQQKGLLPQTSFIYNATDWSRLRLYSLLADVVLLVIFAETWFNHKSNQLA